ncbi:GTP-binding protein gtr2 [Malassezia vespertilionis]|uniref:GTP-binding protein gtr2 n=1 Tax=Malassezia vespertilionis TaxID=2020962 RepID=UPI0024B05905|nr:GTP-binding protein gtr2 [Malassezia vespertilionis]WFD05755.1 GTP-binding protein gtr2 [Malassezia vespertilionis]
MSAGEARTSERLFAHGKGEPMRRKIMILGMRRAGKSSMCKVVFQSYQPNDTLFLPPTARTQTFETEAFQRLEICDVPGSALLQIKLGASKTDAESSTSLHIAWTETSAVVFVVDAQDDYLDAVSKLKEVLLIAYAQNPKIHFHVFIHKVDGLSDDYKYDIQRDVEQRVYEELIDASHDFTTASGEPAHLDADVNIRFHLTSVFNPSVTVAFSRIQQRLMQSDDASSHESNAENSAGSTAPAMISLFDAIESACNALCSICHLEKAFVFDIQSRTYIGCDSSPFDAPLFDVMYEYAGFLMQFVTLYSHIPREQEASKTAYNPADRAYAASSVRLGSDTSLACWRLSDQLALIVTIRTNIHITNSGIIDYNVSIFRHTIELLRGLASPSPS